MQNPPFRSEIVYSVQNEDYRTEQAVLERVRQRRARHILLIASSGEATLSLLTDETVASVDAVDLNPAQLYLCQLRGAASEQFMPEEQLRLLGANPQVAWAGDEAARIALYDGLRLELPEPSRAFWDERRDTAIAFGVQHIGRNDVAMHDIDAALRAAGFAPLERPPRDDELFQWQEVYRSVMTPAYMRQLFGLPNDDIATRIAGVAGIVGECHFRALQQPDADHNPFLTTVFAGSYATAAGEPGLPLYLQSAGHAALRRLGVQDRLRLHVGNLLEQMRPLAEQHGAFDLISVSNIADWMTEEQFHALVAQSRDCLAPGGALLARTSTGRPMIRDVIGAQLKTDAELDRELPSIERGPWFRTIAVGFRA